MAEAAEGERCVQEYLAARAARGTGPGYIAKGEVGFKRERVRGHREDIVKASVVPLGVGEEGLRGAGEGASRA